MSRGERELRSSKGMELGKSNGEKGGKEEHKDKKEEEGGAAKVGEDKETDEGMREKSR